MAKVSILDYSEISPEDGVRALGVSSGDETKLISLDTMAGEDKDDYINITTLSPTTVNEANEDLAEVTTQFNALLTALDALGLIVKGAAST